MSFLGEDSLMNLIRVGISLILFCLLTACAVGPDYVRPVTVVTHQFKEAKGKKIVGGKSPIEWKIAEPRDRSGPTHWWKMFDDQELNDLEDQLNIANQNIANAYDNYVQARALVDEARAQFYPTLVTSYSAIRQRRGGGATSFVSSGTSAATSGTAITSTTGSSVSTTQALILTATWEPDIWGSVRRMVEADAANAEAVAALFSSVQLSAQASLAQYYFQIRNLDADQRLLNETVLGYRRSYRLARNQYNAGVVAKTDVLQAETQLQNAEAQAINNQILRTQYEHAVAVLIGVPPASFSLLPRAYSAKLPAIPVAMPSKLLERRPDIAQAERQMAEANAEIGVAIAAYFPNLSLTASASNTAQNFAKLFSLPVTSWSYGPQLLETIVDGGLRSATVRAAKAAYKATVANYRQVVLTAFQEVEDYLSALRILQKESVVLKASARNAKVVVKMTINQYKAGTVDYTNVVVAQATAYSQAKQAIDVDYNELVQAVQLIKALGGDFNDCILNCAANWQPPKVKIR